MSVPEEVRSDLFVAAVAAATTVGLTLVLQYGLGVTASPLLRLAPLAVYFAYLLFGKGSTGSVLERPRLWMAATVGVAVVVGAYAVA